MAAELLSKRPELPVGPEQSPGGATEGIADEPLQHALRTAYSFLNKRERTAAEVDRRLRHERFSSETIARTLALLHDEGTLDDHRFARLFTDDKRTLEGWGSERIRRVLVQRGIDPDTVAAAVDASRGEGESSSEGERERALAVLLRKGYEPELAVEALSAYSRA